MHTLTSQRAPLDYFFCVQINLSSCWAILTPSRIIYKAASFVHNDHQTSCYLFLYFTHVNEQNDQNDKVMRLDQKARFFSPFILLCEEVQIIMLFRTNVYIACLQNQWYGYILIDVILSQCLNLIVPSLMLIPGYCCPFFEWIIKDVNHKWIIVMWWRDQIHFKRRIVFFFC